MSVVSGRQGALLAAGFGFRSAAPFSSFWQA